MTENDNLREEVIKASKARIIKPIIESTEKRLRDVFNEYQEESREIWDVIKKKLSKTDEELFEMIDSGEYEGFEDAVSELQTKMENKHKGVTIEQEEDYVTISIYQYPFVVRFDGETLTWEYLFEDDLDLAIQKARDERDKVKGIDVRKMATEFHKIYEEEAKESGWKTNKTCQTEFDGLPESNKKTMLRTCARIIEWINENQEDTGTSAGDMIYFASKEITDLKAENRDLKDRHYLVEQLFTKQELDNDKALTTEREKVLDEVVTKIKEFEKSVIGGMSYDKMYDDLIKNIRSSSKDMKLCANCESTNPGMPTCKEMKLRSSSKETK